MGKKRKGHDDMVLDSMKVKIKNSENVPYVVTFPSGYKPGSAEEKWTVYQHAQKPQQQALVVETDKKVDFFGRCKDGKTIGSSSKMMVGVFDRESGKLTLGAMAGDHPIRMEPRVHGTSYDVDPAKDTRNAKVEDIVALRRERNARLIEAFGSQRRKRQLHTAQAGRVDASQISSGEAMLGLIRTAKSDPGSRDEVIKESLSHRNIPPHNKKGTTADEAYPFHDIVPLSVWDSLDTSALKRATEDSSSFADIKKTFGKYVASRVSGAGTFHESDSTYEDRLKCMAFLGYLMLFARDMKKLIFKVQKETGGVAGAAERMKMHPSTLEGILQLFYTREDMEDGVTKYIMDKTRKNLIIAWCLVLSVRAEPQSALPPFAFQTMAEELKMKPAEVANLYRELGCVTKKVSHGYIVTLLKHNPGEDPKTLEQSFPALKLGGKKR